MEQCSRQCIRRTFYGVMVGVLPVVICLLFIGLARLILYRLEIIFYRRQKLTDRRSSLANSQSGRLALSYTPVSNAELQRIIQGEYQSQQSNDSPIHVHRNNSSLRKTPRFIKSILPRREPPTSSSSSILANLVIRCDNMDAIPLRTVLAPGETALRPSFSIVNENEKRRPSVITITRESIETTTLASINNNNNASYSNINNLTESERITNDSVMSATKTMTTTTVVVEEFLDFHSVSSFPCVLSLLNSVSEDDDDNRITEINKDNEEEE